LELTIDGEPAGSETSCTCAGAHVLTVHTVIPRADLALELHSTFIGHSGVDTHVSICASARLGSRRPSPRQTMTRLISIRPTHRGHAPMSTRNA
jgi:hypothetical protein